MITEKPSWIRHEGMQIFSIDIQPGGLRFATGGGDFKVRIWDMKSVGREVGTDESKPDLLATLRDHFGSVNCVRWAKHGRYIASGSDDQVILIHERKPGSGTTEFGSGEPPDVENWKVVMTLRGHTADVVDINWSPDDSALASGSLDNTVHIWDMNTGICTAVLRGHSSLVKGVAWDPIGSFVASQSDDKTVLIWRTSDWTLAHRTDGHWAKSLGSTFFRRLGWSPCGHFITTTHGFQKPRHSAPVLERGEWSATFDFLGHNAPVIVVKFNNTLFRRNPSNNEEVRAALGWTNGSSKTGGKDSTPYNVIAIGSQDRTITVWTTASPRPLFVAKHFFSQSVVDLSWSPDGYSLFACSLDGTVATFHFDVNELGHRLTETEMDELKRNRYGDVRGRQANLAESPAQLLLEAASVKQTPSKKAATDVHASKALLKSSADSRGATKVSKSQIEGGKKIEGGTADGLTKAAPSVAPSAHRSSPVKQREYRRPDGRKRIIPEAVGNVLSGTDFPYNSSDHARDENRILGTDSGIMEASLRKTAGGISDVKEHSGITARATTSESLVIEKVSSSKDKDGCINIEQAGLVKYPDSPTVDILSIRISGNKEAENAVPVCLEARPREHAVNDIVGTGSILMKETEIVCLRGTQTLWSDRIFGKVTVLAGNVNFWAVGCEDGSLQIYTKCGRRALPTMMIGSAAIFIDCDESWKLLLVTRKGSLYVWDIYNQKCLLHNSLTSLITSDPKSIARDAGTIKIISAKLSKSGFPLVTLATRQAYLFDMSLMCWLSVADDCLPASNFASPFNLGSVHGGELAALHADVGKFLTRKPAWGKVADDGVHTRAHLEAQLASAQSLESPNEYRQCLLSYVRFLAREADESRLRELCESFLGPPTGMVEATVEATSLDPKKSAWDPFILGMRKHKLLKEDILPAIASNRKVQRLLNEFIDLISEYEMTEANQEEKSLAPMTSQETANMNSNPPIVDASSTPGLTIPNQLDSIATKINQADSVKPVKEQIDSFLQETDQAQSTPETEPMNLDPPASDQTNITSPAKDMCI